MPIITCLIQVHPFETATILTFIGKQFKIVRFADDSSLRNPKGAAKAPGTTPHLAVSKTDCAHDPCFSSLLIEDDVLHDAKQSGRSSCNEFGFDTLIAREKARP
jgi:hypothetical protein